MSEKMNHIEHKGFVMYPEEREIFAGQKVLVVGGPDAHGVAMAVASAKYLEERGATAQIYVGSPVVKEGKGATHPGAFWTKTIADINVTGVDRVVIADIPLDQRELKDKPHQSGPFWLRHSEKELVALVKKLDTDRLRRGEKKLDTPVIFVDHRSGALTEVWAPRDPVKRNWQLPKKIENKGVLVKSVKTAELCRLGNKNSKVARIGAIADRDAAVLPITEEEKVLARGLDIAVKPDPSDPKPKEIDQISGWEQRAQDRLNKAISELQVENWDYFRQEAEKYPLPDVPILSGFGQVALVDTQGRTDSFGVLKLMEAAIEKAGLDQMPYAIAILRNVNDIKMGRLDADLVTIIKRWTREDLPSVRELLVARFGAGVLTNPDIYGLDNVITMRLPVDERSTAQMVVRLLETFAGQELPDFSEIRSVVMCGDPNSGKSVFSSIFRDALKNLGVRVDHLDLDKAAPTPGWYLEAEIAYKQSEDLYALGKATQEEVQEKKKLLETAAEERRALKRPWSIDLAQEAEDELLFASANHNNDFVIGDIGGGRITKDSNTGKIIKVQRLTAENARILEGTDAVIIVSNNPAGMQEWKMLIENGVDPETGIRINREKPIQIIGLYQSILTGTLQHVTGSRHEAGVVTNLDRSKAEQIYNPAILTTAMFISEAVQRRSTK